MSAYEVETLIGGAMVYGALLCCVYALPTWIVRRFER